MACGNFWGMIEMLTIMKAVMASQMYIYFKTYQIVCVVYVKLIYINYISIKLLKILRRYYQLSPNTY